MEWHGRPILVSLVDGTYLYKYKIRPFELEKLAWMMVSLSSMEGERQCVLLKHNFGSHGLPSLPTKFLNDALAQIYQYPWNWSTM